MQDLGPDMKDLVYRASEEYPLKESEDKWHVIERVISDKRKTGFLQYFFAGGFLLLLLLIGLLTGDPDIPDIYNEPAASAPKSNARHPFMLKNAEDQSPIQMIWKHQCCYKQ